VRQAILQIQKNGVVQEHNEWAKMLFEHISVRSPELLKASHRFGVFSAPHRYGAVVASKGCNGYHCGCIARLLIVRVSTSTGGGMDSLSFTLHEQSGSSWIDAIIQCVDGTSRGGFGQPVFYSPLCCWCKNITGDMTTLTTASDEFVHG
jgi:hypothetical protein